MYHRADFAVTEVNFVSILDIMSSIGGMFSFVIAVLGAVLSVFIENGWLSSILKEIIRDQPDSANFDDRQKRRITSNIRSVVSYKGIYNLNSQVQNNEQKFQQYSCALEAQREQDLDITTLQRE